jgi:hypothetical protein
MKKYELPEWEKIYEKKDNGEELDSIEEFVYEFEPQDRLCRLFRNLLVKAMEYYHASHQ